MALTLDKVNYERKPMETTRIWINEDIAGSPPLQLPSYLRDRIEGRKRRLWDCKTDNISLAEAKRKAIIDRRVRKLSDQADHVKKTVEENVELQKLQAEEAIKRINARQKRAECKRSKRLNSISIRCKKKVADAKMKRLDNIKKQKREQSDRLEAIKEKLAAGIARRNLELRNKQLRSLAACRWCAAKRIQVWWRIMRLKKRFKEFLQVCPKELLGLRKQPDTYHDLRRILISRKNIHATRNLMGAIYTFNRGWARNAGARILLTAFMIKYFPRSVLAYNGELEQTLIEKGEKLVLKFRELIKQRSMYYRRVYQSVLSFGVCWGEYVSALEAWKCVDIFRLIDELHRYWEHLQGVKDAMRQRIEAAGAGGDGDIADSNGVLAHVQAQEDMVTRRLLQLGGPIAIQELREKFGGGNEAREAESDMETEEDPPAIQQQDEPHQDPHGPHQDPHEPQDAPQDQPKEEALPAPQKEETKKIPSDEFYNDMAKMEMAHAIAMDSDYKITRPQASGIQGQIEATMKEAFWDILRADVEGTPPDYKHCVSLLDEIRVQIESIGTLEKLPPAHPFRRMVADVMDIDLIKQQIEHDTFSLPVKVEAIVSILLKLCSTSHDTYIRSILELTDVVEIFKALFEVVDTIKLELANYYLEQAKAAIKEHSVEYERGKFEEFLRTHPSGLDNTKIWLQDNLGDGPMSTISNAYLQLLEVNQPNPETVALDRERYTKIGHNLRTVLICATLNLKLGSYHSTFAEVPFLTALQNTIKILIPDDTNPAEHQDLVLEKVADICSQKLHTCDIPALRNLISSTLDAVLTENKADLLYCLLSKRLSVFLIEASMNGRPEFPKGFELSKELVMKSAKLFVKLVEFNRKVYGPFYARLLKDLTTS